MKKFSVFFYPIFLILLTCHCSEENTTNVPTLANITAVVKGAINLEYSGSGIVTTSTIGNALVLNLGTSTKVNNKSYLLGVFIFFEDRVEKIGKFQFTSASGIIPGDFAVGTFDIVEGGNKKQFISDSGYVDITMLEGTTVRGTFYFRAKEKTTGEVIEVTNGVISF